MWFSFNFFVCFKNFSKICLKDVGILFSLYCTSAPMILRYSFVNTLRMNNVLICHVDTSGNMETNWQIPTVIRLWQALHTTSGLRFLSQVFVSLSLDLQRRRWAGTSKIGALAGRVTHKDNSSTQGPRTLSVGYDDLNFGCWVLVVWTSCFSNQACRLN